MAIVTITIIDVPETNSVTMQLASDPMPDPNGSKTITPAQDIGLMGVKTIAAWLEDMEKVSIANLPN